MVPESQKTQEAFDMADDGTVVYDGEGSDGERSAGVKNNDAHGKGASSEMRKLRYN